MNRRGTDHNSSGSNKRREKTGRRILTGILAFAMILTGQSEFAGVLAVRAEQKEECRVITGFVPLSEETADCTVAVGTPLSGLALPDTLEAYVLSEDAENEGGGVEDPETPDPEEGGDGTGEEENPGGEGDGTGGEGNPGGEDGTGGEGNPGGGDGTGGEGNPGGEDGTGGGENPSGGEEETAGGENPGAAEENAKSTEQEQGAGADTASAGGTLPRETFWDRMTHAVTSWLAGILSPLRVKAAEGDTPVFIELTWESAPAYDGDTQGSYVFTPILPETYALAEDVSLPEIRVRVGMSVDCDHGIVKAGEVCPVCELQEQIDALPEAEEVEEALAGLAAGISQMSTEEIDALYERLGALSDTYDGFHGEWREMVDAKKLFALLALFSGEDMLMTAAGGKDVLIFSTGIKKSKYTSMSAYSGDLAQVFLDAGYGVQIKLDEKEQHLSESDMDGIGLLLLVLPLIAPNDRDISLMRDFLAGGGRIVMIGEHAGYAAQENSILSEAAEKLDANFRIDNELYGRDDHIARGSADMPENALTQDVKESLYCCCVAPIIYSGSAEPVLMLKGQAWMVDQAAGKGRIMVISDINCFDPLTDRYSFRWKGTAQERADTKAWIVRWLLDARKNQETVLSNRNPNLGFGGSPTASVDAKDHVAALGDYSFTVTYSVSDRSSARTIDETTIDTDDVSVTDENGASLLIGGAQIVSGQGTKELTVRYTVEAQQSGYFTPGKYTIGINSAAVADVLEKQMSSDPQAAVFQVITSPLQITGPDNIVIPQKGTGSLSVSVSSKDGKSYTYQYQWYQKKNGAYEEVKGATGAVYTLPEAVTGVSGGYTYRCEVWASGHTEFRIPSEDALVTVEKGIAIDTPTAAEISGKDCEYTLSATLLEAGSERITETGFVWGIMGSPTLSLNSGSAKTTSPVTAANQKISVAATGLTKTVTYYGRAYVKTAGGNVVYSNAVSFGKTGNMGQFSVKNNGDSTFTVTLTGGVGEQMVFYRTVNGSAVGGTHFTHKVGMLTFNGSGSQTVTVTESAVTSIYGGKPATAFSNADRTYSLEIYRPIGGATISTGTAERTMQKRSTVNRTIYTEENQDWPSIEQSWVTDHSGGNAGDIVWISDRSNNTNPGKKNFSHSDSVTSRYYESSYIKDTAEAYLYRYEMKVNEHEDGWEHAWLGTHAPGNAETEEKCDGSYDDGKAISLTDSKAGAALWTAVFELKESKNGNAIVTKYFPTTQIQKGADDGTKGHTVCAYNAADGSLITENEKCYVKIPVSDTVYNYFSANGSGEDMWWVAKAGFKDYTKIYDTREPQLLGVAPMAQTAYAIGDNITIALVFDEIVDVQNSKLGNVKIKTNVTGDLDYSGGGDTNVLYFTGKVTTEFKGGEIQLKDITDASNIKDMCDTVGAANTSTSGSTPITTTGTSAPKLTLTNNGVTNGVAKAQISAQNADLLQYCWTQDANMPAAGWIRAGGTTYTATNPAQTAGTYYLHAMAVKRTTGEAAYEKTSFTVTQEQQQEQENKLELTANTDNSQWARSRTILLEKKGSGSLTLTVKKPDGTTQTVTGNSYTATANGEYTFTLSNGTKTVTQKVTVSKIDRTNPKVTVDAVPTAWQADAPTINISGTDTSGTDTNGSGIASLQYKWVTAKGTYPTDGLTSLGKTGVSVSGTVENSGLTDGVNYLYYKAVDGVGNTVQGYSSALRLDTIAPAITLEAAQTDSANAVFSVTVKYGPSNGKTTFQKQGDSAVMSVRGSAAGISGTPYKYQFKADTGVNEAGSYTFTATSGAGKTAAANAPGIYQVTLDAGEGVFESDMREEGEELPHTDTWLVVSGGKIVKPTYGAPVREHYTVEGWYTDFACTADYDFNTPVTADRIIYAGWTPDTYQVTYEKNGGTIANETTFQKYTYSKGLTLPTAEQITRTGYTFGGWYTDEAFADDTMVTEITETDADDRTFYAKWTANEYTVTYDYQDATGGDSTKTKQVIYDAAYGDLPAPEKTGYSFKGWYTQELGKGDKVLDTTKMTVARDHNLYAYWVDDLKPDAPVLQEDVTLPEGWTHTHKTIPLTLHDGVGVTELWVSVDSGEYKKVDGFTGQSSNDSYDYVYKGVQEGEHTYRFKAKDAARNESAPSALFTVKLDTTEAALTVTGPNVGAEKKTGVTLTAQSGSFGPGGGILSVKKDGQTEETTLKDSAGSGILSADHTVKETGIYHFYSRTKANKAAEKIRYVHQVTFDSDGGSAVEPQLVWTSHAAESDAGGSADGTVECKVKKPADPTKKGHHFGGWYTDEACQNTFDFDTQLYEDTTLYAGWTQDSVPEITAQLSAESAESGWYTEKPQITLRYADAKGMTQILVSVDGGTYEALKNFAGGSPAQLPTSGTDTYTELQQGEHTYTFKAVNTTGLTAETEPIRVKLDTVKPALGDISYNDGYVNLWNWIIRKDSLLVNIPVTEAESGLAKVTYTLTPGSMQSAEAVTKEAKIEKRETDAGTVYTAVIAIDPDYKGVIGEIQAVDAAGNVSEPKTAYANGIGVIVESEKPVITVKADRLPADTQAGTAPEGEELSTAYYQTAPTLLVKVQDGTMAASGIKEVKWQIGNDAEHTVSEDFTAAMKTESSFRIDGLDGLSGAVQVKITAVDNAGNSESKTVTIKIKGKEQTPDAVPDYPAEKLTGLLPGNGYLIRLPDGTEVSRNADAKGEIPIDDGWFGTEISVIKKGDGVNTEDSDAQSLALAARPAAPGLGKSDETIKGKKDGKVTGLTTAMEYSTDGGRTWTVAAGDLTDVSAGKYLVRIKAVQTAPHGKSAEVVVGEGRTLTVTFDVQGGSAVAPITGLSWRAAIAKPADPTKADVVFAGWFKEISCTNRWHFAAEDTVDKVEEDITLYAKWIPRAETPAAVIAYRTETLTGLTPGAAYLIDGRELTASADGSVPIDEKWFGKTISIIKRGNGTDTGDSNPQLLPVPNRPAGPEQVKPKAESKKNGNNGKLTKTDTTMQYRKKGSTEWISITGEEVTDLEPGDYELRYMASDTAFASKIVVRTVKKYSPPKGDDDKKDDDGGKGDDNPGGETPPVGDGTDPDGGRKPGADTEPNGGGKPGADTEPGGGRKPGAGTEPNGGRKPGADTKPGGGRKPGADTEPDGGGKPGADTETGGRKPGVDMAPEHTVDDGRIVPKAPSGDGMSGGQDSGGAANENGADGSGTGADSGAGGSKNWSDAHPYAVGRDMKTLTIPVDAGAVIVTVNNIDETLCTAQAADAVAVANAVLTREETARVSTGETVEIRIDVERIDERVSGQEKALIEQGIGEVQEETSGLTVGMYVDISMFLRRGKGEWNAVHKTNEPVEIVIDVPEELFGLNADFYIVRAHEGVCTLLRDLDDAAETITIETECFSTYAIAYRLTDGSARRCGLCHICPTFLGICYFIWLAVIIAAAVIVVIVWRRREDKEPQD